MFMKVNDTTLEINEEGILKNSKTGYIYKAHIDNSGYLMLGNIKQLFNKTRMVHKLVYFTFNNIPFESELNNPIRFQIAHRGFVFKIIEEAVGEQQLQFKE